MLKIDELDIKILQLLQENAKYTIKEISSHLHLTPTPVFERIKKLEAEGIITGYEAQLNRKKLGKNLLVYCQVVLESHHQDKIKTFEKDVLQFSEILECHHIAGNYDYMMKILVDNMDNYQDFIKNKLASLENIGKVQSSFVMSEIKSDNKIPLDSEKSSPNL